MNKPEITPEQWVALLEAASTHPKLGTARIMDIGAKVLGTSRAAGAFILRDPEITRDEAILIANEVMQLLTPNDVYLIAYPVLGNDRILEILQYLGDSLTRRSSHSGPVRPNHSGDWPVSAEIVQSPDNRLINPGRIIQWWGDNGSKEIWQRDTGYFAGSFGDKKAYNFEKALVDQWDGFCSLYEDRSGDATLRAGGPTVIAVYTEVKSWFGPEYRAVFKDTGEAARAPDDTLYKIVTASGHTFEFLVRNGRDHIGEAGSGAGHVIDPSGKYRASWNMNRTWWNGKQVGFRP